MRTRCSVDRSLSSLQRISMSPILQVTTPGRGSTSVQASSADFLSRAKLQPTLAGALMQKRKAIEIGVRSGAPAGEIRGLGVDHRQIMQKPQRALIFARLRIVTLGEEVRLKAELQRETGQHLHAERPIGALEGEHRRLEARQFVARRPESRPFAAR